MNITAFDPAFCEQLLTTFAHFLWQGTVIAIIAAVANVVLRRAGPNWRHALMLTPLLVMAACPWITFQLLSEVASRTTADKTVAASLDILKRTAHEPTSNTDNGSTAHSNTDHSNDTPRESGAQRDASSLSPLVVLPGDSANGSLETGSRRVLRGQALPQSSTVHVEAWPVPFVQLAYCR